MSLSLAGNGKELRERFFALRTRQDVALLLDISDAQLKYHLYIAKPSNSYASFTISKKRGGTREISAPVSALKIIQRKLAQVLKYVYEPKPSTHGFTVARSIKTNAEKHIRKKHVLNVDLKDFFPSINFGRVRGLFMAQPYDFNSTVATVLAQICCFDNKLPQGAPTSPIISNMICARMDTQLQRLAADNRCTYTRYADDLTFSTSISSFPSDLAIELALRQVQVGTKLREIIENNGFQINADKVRLQTRSQRQEVTGLTTNRFVNVERAYMRQIRAMLHAWRKFGLEAAQQEYLNKYSTKHYKSEWPFKEGVKGKIEFVGMVRGKDDSVYRNLLQQYANLDPGFVLPAIMPESASNITPLVFTEGKTDWQHLKNALSKLQTQGKHRMLRIDFQEDDQDTGDVSLLRRCQDLARISNTRPFIFIFDRDNHQIIRQVIDEASGNVYRSWGNNVHSLAIPIPPHRQDLSEISIELYYTDDELRRRDVNGRRLFLNTEFNESSGRHESENLNCTDRNKLRRRGVCIVDNDVYDEMHTNIALPKSDFANNILDQTSNFDDFGVSAFEEIFKIIQKILTCL